MTDCPHSLSLHRKLARKLPKPVRRWFVRTVDQAAAKRGEPGRHSGAYAAAQEAEGQEPEVTP